MQAPISAPQFPFMTQSRQIAYHLFLVLIVLSSQETFAHSKSKKQPQIYRTHEKPLLQRIHKRKAVKKVRAYETHDTLNGKHKVLIYPSYRMRPGVPDRLEDGSYKVKPSSMEEFLHGNRTRLDGWDPLLRPKTFPYKQMRQAK